jgi:hypothetical protein
MRRRRLKRRLFWTSIILALLLIWLASSVVRLGVWVTSWVVRKTRLAGLPG